MAEQGGVGLYGFCWNAPVDRADVLGLEACCGPLRYDPSRECCRVRDGVHLVLKKGVLRRTGYETCVRYSRRSGLHVYAVFDRDAWGFYGDPSFGGMLGLRPGIVDREYFRGGYCTKQLVFECRVNVERLRSCIAQRIAHDVDDPPYYSITYQNCAWWVRDVYYRCERAARW